MINETEARKEEGKKDEWEEDVGEQGGQLENFGLDGDEDDEAQGLEAGRREVKKVHDPRLPNE